MADAYLVDTSSFLKIYEDYPVTHRQLILNGLDPLIQISRIRTVRVVLDEVSRNNERLGDWLQEHKDHLLLPNDDQLIHAAFLITRSFPDIYDEKRNYLQADPFLVGAAQTYNLVMVTDELPRHLRRRRSQNERHIPDVCSELGIRCLNLSQMLTVGGII
jgi:hypothetical protein